jgi:phthiocerol/phenolphthiocerol synthesis type-I polyketide synthase E
MNNDIAIIGMSCRYPKSNSPTTFWENIIGNIDLYQDIIIQNFNEINLHKYFYLENIEFFDNQYFNYSEYEANVLDPQHRMLLKCAKEALENSGCEKETVNSRTGVFTTSSLSTYLLHNIIFSEYYDSDNISYPILIGNDKDFLSSKISYKLNLTGPSINIQSACSSSLVATHYACQSLLNFECDRALVGGVSISIPQNQRFSYKVGSILSPEGICRPFDNAANGTIKGNGCGVLILKRASDAIHDRDNILAIIKGSAVNNDGAQKTGFTAPSITGQTQVIEEALTVANIPLEDIDYIEAHGTGTKLGDPIEISALANVFKHVKKNIPIGSIKSNIGHLDVAAGITSIIKGISILKHQQIPAIKNFSSINEEIKNIQHPFNFPTTPITTKVNNIAISSFGLGGTNAHMIISKYLPAIDSDLSRELPFYLVPITFSKNADLVEYGNTIKTHLLATNVNFVDFVWSFSTGTRRKTKTIFIITSDKNDFLYKLDNLSNNGTSEDIFTLELSEIDCRILGGILPELNELYIKNNNCLTGLNNFLKNLNIAEKFYLIRNKDHTTGSLHPLLHFFNFLGNLNQLTEINFNYLYSSLNRHRVALPFYPLQEKRFWIEGKNQQTENKQCNDFNRLTEVLQIWSKVINIKEKDITPDTTFFALNIDSLMTLELADNLTKKFNTEITIDDFKPDLTPRLLLAIIQKRAKNFSKQIISHIIKNDNHKSIFLIHAAGGTTMCYNTLAYYLSENYNLYAIDLPENHNAFSSMAELGAYYLQQIKEYQPEGPYYLGGYSFGGNLAYEIAAQLEKNHEIVKQVFMFDSHPPEAYACDDLASIDYVYAFPKILSYYFNDQRITIPKHELSNTGHTLTEILRLINQNKTVLSEISEKEIVSFYQKWVYNHKLLKLHTNKQKISADLILFLASDAEDERILDLLQIKIIGKSLWKNYFTGKFHETYIPGNHYNIFNNKENIKILAKYFDHFASHQ